MKLVDILARELKEWPDCEEIFQDYDGELRYMGNPVSTRSHCFVEMCDDLIRPKYGVNIKGITQPQWKEARDALLKADSKEWNGEGLPPVGTVCEFRIPEEFDGVSPWRPELRQGNRVEIIYRYDTGVSEVAVFKFDVAVGFLVEQASAGCFRPIRTPEQIAAEERSIAISDIINTIGWLNTEPGCHEAAGRLYDAGYRKQEPK